MRSPLWLIGFGGGLSVLGVAMNFAWDRLSDVDPPPPIYPILEHGSTPVFVVGLLALATGCVALSREWLPKRNYAAAGIFTGTAPMTALLLRLGVLRFDLGSEFQDWTLMLLVLVFTVFMLGLMFLVAAVSYRRWE